MKNLQLPVSLKREVKEFFINTQARQDQQEELNDFLTNISPSLRLAASIQIFKAMLEENPVFSVLLHTTHAGNSTNTSALNFIVRRLEVELKMPEHAFIN